MRPSDLTQVVGAQGLSKEVKPQKNLLDLDLMLKKKKSFFLIQKHIVENVCDKQIGI